MSQINSNYSSNYNNNAINAINSNKHLLIPHRGALCRIHMNIDNTDISTSYNQPTSFIYAINILSHLTLPSSSNPSPSPSPSLSLSNLLASSEHHYDTDNLDFNVDIDIDIDIDDDDDCTIHAGTHDEHQSSNSNTNKNNENENKCQYQLQYHAEHYKFMKDVFSILDTESRGYITKHELEDFVLLRCPVFKRRDENLQAFALISGDNNDDDKNDDKNNDDNNDNNGDEHEKRIEKIDCNNNESSNYNYHYHDDHGNDNDNYNENVSPFKDDNHGNDNDNHDEEYKHIHDDRNNNTSNYDNDTSILEGPNERDIFNCILGESGERMDEGGGQEEGEGEGGKGIGDFQSANSKDDHDLYHDNHNYYINDYEKEKQQLQQQEQNYENTIDQNYESYFTYHNEDTPKPDPIEEEEEEEEDNVYTTSTGAITDTDTNDNDNDVTNAGTGTGTDNTVYPNDNKNQSVRSNTFEEVWDAVIQCSVLHDHGDNNKNKTHKTQQDQVCIGIEAWMVFCRFISLAQYQDAKRRFSARHLQQAMPQKTSTTTTTTTGNNNIDMCRSNSFSEINSSQSSNSNEVILVDLPPLERPVPISAQHLIEYELMTLKKSEAHSDPVGNTIGIALPELDLDHSHLLLHDGRSDHRQMKSTSSSSQRFVQITVFGQNNISPTTASSISTNSPSDGLEFVIRLVSNNNSTNTNTNINTTDTESELESDESIIVRRSFADMSWLHDTFKSQKELGGTLCGRILPPFPSPLGSSYRSLSSTRNYDEEKIISSSSSAAISVASASAVMVTSAAKSAKSFLGRTLKAAAKSSSKSLSNSKKSSPVDKTTSTTTPLTSKRPSSATNRNKKYITVKESMMDNPISKSKQLERYINYMLDHPAMSTSFPLNVMLKASQSGVESAKRILKNQVNSNRDVNHLMENGSVVETRYNLEKYGISGNLSWVRTAAQAALALKLHGILETTGYQSVSAKLQHASLPKISKVGALSMGDEERGTQKKVHHKKEVKNSMDDFEKGIVCVESNLYEETHYDDNGNGYDMLPSPLPLPERSALCAGSVHPSTSTTEVSPVHQSNRKLMREAHQSGVRYSDTSGNDDTGNVILGDISVDKDIDRLRDMIRKVDVGLSRCLSAGLCVGTESCEKTGFQLDLLREIDYGEGWGGRMIGQKALLNGVESLENTRKVFIANTESFVTDVCWNTSLASSAVAAADEVRDAVKASRTSSRAKVAAETAAKNADQVFHTTQFSTADEARNAQVRASKLRSQAIHAAVVEYEAVTAKRQATVALARDVKCWNVHRKQELLRTCLKIVKSHKKIALESVNAWEGLRDGLLESSSISSIVNSSVKPFQNTKGPAVTDTKVPTSQPPDTNDFSAHESMDVVTAMHIDPNFDENTYPAVPSQPSDIEDGYNQNMDIISKTPDIASSFDILSSYDGSIGPLVSSQTPDIESAFSQNMHFAPPSKTPDIESSFDENIAPMLSTQPPDIESSFDENIAPVLTPQPPDIESGLNKPAVFAPPSETPDIVNSYDESMDLVPPSQTPDSFEETLDALSSYTPDMESSFHDTFEENIPTEDTLTNMNLKSRDCSSNPHGINSVDQVTPLKNMPCDRSTTTEPCSIREDIIYDSNRRSNSINDSDNLSPKNDAGLFIPEHDDSQLIAGQGNMLYNGTPTMEVRSDNGMTDSMQSLVDGLMNWGGQWDEEEDLAPLPHGMAASMLDERGLLE